MDSKTYLNESKRTAPTFENDALGIPNNKVYALAEIAQQIVSVGNMLDDLKKNIYYGKEIEWISDLPQETAVKLYDGKQADIIHGVVGKTTEAVELLEALLPLLEKGDFDDVNAIEEIGDGFWYDALLLRALDSDFESTFQININKLYKRFPEKFDSSKAIDRDVTTERETLEKGVNKGKH